MDYRNFGTDGPKNTAPTASLDRQWWRLKGIEAAGSISNTLDFLQKHQTRRLSQHAVSARLYGNVALLGMAGVSMSKLSAVAPGMKDRISYNVVESAVDTITAKIAKNKPRPLFLTSGGDYRLQRQAKKLTQFVDGVFYENKAHALGIDVFRDACVFDTGGVHVFAENNRVKFERVLTSELYVDELEAFYGSPRQMHWVRNVDRGVLADVWKNKRADIMAANQASATDSGQAQNISDMVTVRESWHLPSGPKAKDGRHMITIDGAVLLDEGWDKPRFPFAFFHWNKRLYGFWGQGLAEQIQNIQLEINKLLWVIQRSMHLSGSFKVLVENTSKIVTEHLSNDIGAVIRYSGTPPSYVVPPAVPPEIYQHLITLKNAAFEQAGISMLSAVSQKPAGLNSGKALREYNDIESDRFAVVGKAYEQFFLDLASLAIDSVKEVVEDAGSYEVQVPGKKFLDTVDWKDIDLEDDQYVMQCFPVSSLPNDPAGRLETIQEYAQAGFITPRQARRLLDFPDLDQVDSLQNAAEDYLTQILERMVDEGEYTPPESFDDLALARELALQFYQQGKSQDLEQERLELLRIFLGQLDVLQAAAMAPPPGMAPGAPPDAGGAPTAVPEAPPTSDLLPTAPGIQ